MKKKSLLVKPLRLVLILVTLAATTFASLHVASAHHVYATYGARGYLKMATQKDKAIIFVASTKCRAIEDKAWKRIRATTEGYWSTRWPSGLRFTRFNCTGAITTSVNIKLSYERKSNFVRSDGNPYGGYNESFASTPNFCSSWNVQFPCGSKYSIVHLNNSRFKKNSGYSKHYKRRLIMHETGHSLGLAHHCNGDSVMNDGTASCNGGAWYNTNGYLPTDRTGIRNVYPNWKYQ